METRTRTYFITTTRVAIQLLLVIFVAGAIHSCKDDDDDDQPVPSADETLFNESSTTSGYSYYQSGNILPADPNSPHGSFLLRFNSIAAAALDSTGELPVGGTFPNGSILVKEVYVGTTLSLYAVMKKDPGSSNSGQGWLWAEYEPDGAVNISVLDKGNDGCVSCHTAIPNRDLVRTFDFH